MSQEQYSSSCKGKGKLEGITFQTPIPECRCNEVLDHMRKSFYVNEPLLTALDVIKVGEPQPEMDAYVVETVKEGCSVAALDSKTDKIVGVALNGVMRSSDPDLKEKLDKMNSKVKLIFEMINNSNKHLDLFCRYGVDEIFEIRLISVDSTYSGKGIARELVLRSDNLGRKLGFKLGKADCTGFFSQKAFIKNGYEKIHEIKYACYKDKQGNVIFKTKPPHESMAVLVKHYDGGDC
ncbi:hypothetical protein LSTR_LSTR005107 [Laodelphax striatellus]|uniref:aralkylamine N-acetyltransferase n=1 Tax=Laodelphax striatellus TaxID=195883 RepID=A0A482WPQ6_LAOST|nr:hypothetical protein LSTR_LSTR005107 [Laodelphax striatellus]